MRQIFCSSGGTVMPFITILIHWAEMLKLKTKEENRILTLFIGDMVRHGRSGEDMYDLPYAGNSANSSANKPCLQKKPP